MLHYFLIWIFILLITSCDNGLSPSNNSSTSASITCGDYSCWIRYLEVIDANSQPIPYKIVHNNQLTKTIRNTSLKIMRITSSVSLTTSTVTPITFVMENPVPNNIGVCLQLCESCQKNCTPCKSDLLCTGPLQGTSENNQTSFSIKLRPRAIFSQTQSKARGLAQMTPSLENSLIVNTTTPTGVGPVVAVQTQWTANTSNTPAPTVPTSTQNPNQPTTYTLGGTITGLASNGLELKNNLETLSLNSSSSSFIFQNKLRNGASYAVSISSQPTDYTCIVSNGTGIIPASNVTNISVTCSQNPKKIFLTSATHNTNFGTTATEAIVAADAFCMSDSNNPKDGSTYKAMLVSSGIRVACVSSNCVSATGTSENLNWIFAPDTTYFRSLIHSQQRVTLLS